MEFRLKQTLKDGKTFDYELIEGDSVIGVSQLRIEPSKGASLPNMTTKGELVDKYAFKR